MTTRKKNESLLLILWINSKEEAKPVILGVRNNSKRHENKLDLTRPCAKKGEDWKRVNKTIQQELTSRLSDIK